MVLKKITEENSIEFINNFLDYLKMIDSNSVNNIITSDNPLCTRNNTGWYRYEDNKHTVNINVPNLLCAKSFVDRKMLDITSYYAFLALVVGHEFRHFLQGKCIFDGEEIEGYGQKDVLDAELMLYIRYFFDAYYLLNKGNVKYEVDAEKFGVVTGLKFMEENFPNIWSEKAMVKAVNFYATIQNNGFGEPTLPLGFDTTEDIINELTRRLDINGRVDDLTESLFVTSPYRYEVHERFGLDESKVLTPELIEQYRSLTNGSERDLLVTERIMSLLERPAYSLEEFPKLKKIYGPQYK